MDLSVDSALTLLNLEGALVSPSVVPGINCKPVVFATFSSPANELDSVSTECRSALVRVNSALVGEEVLIHSEGCSHSSILVDILFDVIDTSNAIGRSSVLLVSVIVNAGVGWASLITRRLNLSNIITAWKSL